MLIQVAGKESHMDDYTRTNLDHWNELVSLHAQSKFYDLQSFKVGNSTLKPIEVEELGDVAGKSLLHLQCHFGLDTLSWARRGAQVTGADFSDQAIALALSLSKELKIKANFVRSDLYDLPNVLSGEFDIVYTSYGVLCWLSDLGRWGKTIAHFLKPGGVFYIVEFHPFANVFDNEDNATDLRVVYPYFSREPFRWESDVSYADLSAPLQHRVTYEWFHSLGDILNALISAGLTIEFLHEFPVCAYRSFPFMEQGADGWWRLKGGDTIPFMFSLKATKTS
jgi:SAM-dependent methyltransferase